MEENKLTSGFRINNLGLLESSFARKDEVFFNDLDNRIDIDTRVSVNDNVIVVREEVVVEQKHQENVQVTVKVVIGGVFEMGDNPSLTDLDEFGRINGAAIIFPYIREHITNLSLKAGIQPIILPPINFTKNRKMSDLDNK
jgi:preprotein translocase subunit SecB